MVLLFCIPVSCKTTNHCQVVVAERSRALIYRSWRARRGFESRWRNIFILNFSLPFRSEVLSGPNANEIKHDHSLAVIVVLDPKYD